MRTRFIQITTIIVLVSFLAGCGTVRVPFGPIAATGGLWTPPAPTGLGRMEYTPTERAVDTSVSECIGALKQSTWADDKILTYCLRF